MKKEEGRINQPQRHKGTKAQGTINQPQRHKGTKAQGTINQPQRHEGTKAQRHKAEAIKSMVSTIKLTTSTTV
jgi:hypothetical protein